MRSTMLDKWERPVDLLARLGSGPPGRMTSTSQERGLLGGTGCLMFVRAAQPSQNNSAGGGEHT